MQMSDTLHFIFGCHAHQPVGNFDFVFRDAFERAYRPFIEVLERHPRIHATLHYTGPLLDWFEENTPEFLERIQHLVAKGQVEILGGAHYEPLLCAIPYQDAIDQIHAMLDRCESLFGIRPTGMWLAERVWEPHLPSRLSECGIRYVMVDDTHFMGAGLQAEDLFFAYRTEDEGKALFVFPILKRLRYLIPFHAVEETLEYLRKVWEDHPGAVAVVHDDSEKFGTWPGTFHSVYEEGWLDRFFTALESVSEWLAPVTYSEYLKDHEARGLVYLPTASYTEMTEWVLPVHAQRTLHRIKTRLKEDVNLLEMCEPFLRGGFWRGFLAKYPEANWMQKRMLHLSRRYHQLRRHAADDNVLLLQAQQHLHQAQCNCAYWHGIFGGLYLNHLRTAVYQHVIAAEVLLDEYEGRDGRVLITAQDIDCDGHDELMVAHNRAALFVAPHEGGSVREYDDKTLRFNFFNTLTRREEAYHDWIRQNLVHTGDAASGKQSIHELHQAKEADLDKALVYDPWCRTSFRDRVLPCTLDLETVRNNRGAAEEHLPKAPYTATVQHDTVHLYFRGLLRTGVFGEIHKTITLHEGTSGFTVSYEIRLDEPYSEFRRFGTEVCVNLLTGSAPDRYFWSREQSLQKPPLGTMLQLREIRHLALRDEWQRLDFEVDLSVPAEVYTYPIETVSQSEAGLERVYQGTAMLFTWLLPQTCPTSLRVAMDIQTTSTVG
jgi:alpha-amylase